jgi:hypothetical protein
VKAAAGPSADDGAVHARHAVMDLARQFPELWTKLNSLTLAHPIDWPEVLRTLRAQRERPSRRQAGADSPS